MALRPRLEQHRRTRGHRESAPTARALSHSASQDDKASLLGLLNVQLDSLFPAIRWKPF
jgi:hypothetical protein